MIKKLCIVAMLLIAFKGFTQEGATTSPYSFFGVGIQQFKGTVESRAMGGLQTYSDSLHINLLNPASLGKLKFTTFAIGGNSQQSTAKTNEVEEGASKATLDYLALAFPLNKKLGVSFGVLPFTAVGYQIDNDDDVTLNRFSGSGGVNRAFLSAGYELEKGLNLGLSFNYNFGNIQNTSLRTQENVELGTEENNRSDISGLGIELAVQYERKITNKLELKTSFKYVPPFKINARNSRDISTVLVTTTGITSAQETVDVDVDNIAFSLPSSVTFGLGIGAPNKWFVGGEYTSQTANDFSNRTFTLNDVSFEDVSQVRLGGFYIPKYNSISSYWSRITYRAGFRYEETGIVLSNEDINEFGISFGVGLPAGRSISNLNLTAEYGQRGTTDANLVQENFLNIGVSLSINDLWFVKSKFN